MIQNALKYLTSENGIQYVILSQYLKKYEKLINVHLKTHIDNDII